MSSLQFARQARGVRLAAISALIATLGLGGCAASYELTLMPRDSGKLAHGVAHEVGAGQAEVDITLGDKLYRGTWVAVTPEQTIDYVGVGRPLARGYGGAVVVDQDLQTVAKALLQADDGSGLRCDFYGLNGGPGTGRCTDDKGLVYDVQIRSRTLP